jgi:hypothetical protein
MNGAPRGQGLKMIFRKMGKTSGDLFKMVERKAVAGQENRKEKRGQTQHKLNNLIVLTRPTEIIAELMLLLL